MVCLCEKKNIIQIIQKYKYCYYTSLLLTTRINTLFKIVNIHRNIQDFNCLLSLSISTPKVSTFSWKVYMYND